MTNPISVLSNFIFSHIVLRFKHLFLVNPQTLTLLHFEQLEYPTILHGVEIVMSTVTALIFPTLPRHLHCHSAVLLFSVQNMFVSDAMFMKMLVGEDADKSKASQDEPPVGVDTGDVFKSLGVLPQSVYDRGSTVNADAPRVDCSAGAYELTVRPVLSNFLGRLHGGALAMSIEHTARMHASCMRDQSDGQSGSKGQGWMDGADTDPGPGSVLGASPPTIVRMEITYKTSMTSSLQITCSHDPSSGSSDQENTLTAANSADFSSNPFRIAGRRSRGEVFNRTVPSSSKSPSGDGDHNKSGGNGPEASATYTCYWSSQA